MSARFWAAPIETVLAEVATRPGGLTQIEDDRHILLMFAMTHSLFLGETTDGVIVLAIVVLIAVVLWLLNAFGVLSGLSGIRVGP